MFMKECYLMIANKAIIQAPFFADNKQKIYQS
nr:MAG TPA: hypothetical protein [Caudoviricetes sp.]